MTKEGYEEFIKSEKYSWISGTVNQLRRHNSDYDTLTIKSMVLSSVMDFETVAEITRKGLYLKTLKRILQEKGVCYVDGQFHSESVGLYDEFGNEKPIDKTYYDIHHDPFRNASQNIAGSVLNVLSDKEKFVVSCIFQLEPTFFDPSYQTIWEKIPVSMLCKRMTATEIGTFLNIAPSKVRHLYSTAMATMRKDLGKVKNGRPVQLYWSAPDSK